jgi:hypothetical protein
MDVLKPVRRIAGKAMCKGDKATPNVALHRLNICKECQYLFKPTMQCKKCLCFVDEKTKCLPEHCPAGKW